MEVSCNGVSDEEGGASKVADSGVADGEGGGVTEALHPNRDTSKIRPRTSEHHLKCWAFICIILR